MYEQFFGLRERPFDLTPNPRFMVLTESHREALSNLRYGIASRKGVTLLIGEAGSGKTTVIRTAVAEQPRRVHCVHLHNPTLTRGEFSTMLAARFGLSEKAVNSKAFMLIELEALLRRREKEGETTVLVLDEAQSLPLELLEEIRLLANIETDNEKLLSVIVAGQPELADRLNEESLRQLKQRVALRCDLRPLTVFETTIYIDGRLHAAGGNSADVFTPEAVAMIHAQSRGLPRLISVIADNALLGGFAAGARPVGRNIVWEVCRDFDLQTEGTGPSPTRLKAPLVNSPAQVSDGAAPAFSFGAESGEELEQGLESAEAEGSEEPVDEDAAVGAADDRRGLFGSFRSKRKRFSFFGN